MRKGFNKYRAKKTEYNEILYDSKKEAEFARKLDLTRKSIGNTIIDIQRQIPFEIKVNGVKICKYVLDFLVKHQDGSIEYIDVKGFKTPVYRLKKKLVEAIYGITITEK